MRERILFCRGEEEEEEEEKAGDDDDDDEGEEEVEEEEVRETCPSLHDPVQSCQRVSAIISKWEIRGSGQRDVIR